MSNSSLRQGCGVGMDIPAGFAFRQKAWISCMKGILKRRQWSLMSLLILWKLVIIKAIILLQLRETNLSPASTSFIMYICTTTLPLFRHLMRGVNKEQQQLVSLSIAMFEGLSVWFHKHVNRPALH